MKSLNRIYIPLQIRITLAFLGMALIVLIAIGAGIWFANTFENSLRANQRGNDQIEKIAQLQSKWQAVISLVDTMLLYRVTGKLPVQLADQLNQLDRQLIVLTAQPLGLSKEGIAKNGPLARDIQGRSAALNTTIYEIIKLANDGQWSQAQILRRDNLIPLQTDFEGRVKELEANIREDVSYSISEAQRIQRLTRTYWISTAILALVAAVIAGWSLARRITHPVKKLTADTERVTGGDLRPVSVIDRNDEIGELSRSFSLMTDWLRESYENLDQRVIERTRDLQRRTTQIQVAAQIARDVSALQKHDPLVDDSDTAASALDQLLNLAVNLIRDRFGFYHAGIFLLDQQNQYAVLKAATGEAGRQLLARNHRLKVGETGIVGYVTGKGQPRIAMDVGSDTIHFRNPLLPETRSEMALPLKVGDRVIGALDVQSKETAVFDEDDITILQIMADQLAVAIENARLMQEMKSNLREIQAMYRLHGEQSWQRYRQENPILGYKYDQLELTPIYDYRKNGHNDGNGYHGEPVLSEELSDGDNGRPSLTIPLQSRGAQVGLLEVWPLKDEVIPETEETLRTICIRLSEALESARLFQEIKNRAMSEKITGEISTRIRDTLDINLVLQTAIREIADKLGIPEVEVYLGDGKA